jgi:hypothetical protein
MIEGTCVCKTVLIKGGELKIVFGIVVEYYEAPYCTGHGPIKVIWADNTTSWETNTSVTPVVKFNTFTK